jgi:hypothetical protein
LNSFLACVALQETSPGQDVYWDVQRWFPQSSRDLANVVTVTCDDAGEMRVGGGRSIHVCMKIVLSH